MKLLRRLALAIASALALASPAFASGNTLTLTSPTYDTTGEKFGTAALNGGYASVTFPTSQGVGNGLSITVEGWFRYTGGSGLQVFMGFDGGPWVGTQNGNITGAGFGGLGYLSPNAWHWIVMELSAAGAETIWMDGSQVGSNSAGGIPSGAAFRVDNLTYGSTVNGYQLAGEADEVAVWTGLKYSGTTITAPSAAYTGGEQNLVALYHLDSSGSDSQMSASATGYTVSPTSGTLYNGQAASFTVSANGALSQSETVSIMTSGVAGTLSASSVTLTSAQTSQSFTFTPSATGAVRLTFAASPALGTDPGPYSYTVSYPALTVGSLSVNPSATGLTVSTASALTGGNGQGLSYSIYRGTDPNFTSGSGSLLTTTSTLPYTDTTAVAGQPYYYGLVGSDSAGDTVNAVPSALSALAASSSTLLYASGQLYTPDVNLVFAGDSITYGYGLSNPGTMTGTAPGAALARVQKSLGLRNIYGANTGVSGANTLNWCPGQTYYTNGISSANASSGASTLHTAHPNAKMVFSIMLGTNDSSYGGPCGGASGGPISAATYTANVEMITDQIISDWPGATVIWHMSPYYTPNTHNGATYEQAGLSRLQVFRSALKAAITAENAKHPGEVLLGDTYSFQFFAQNYASEMQADGSGPNGNFYLHPNSTGAADLGELWGRALATDLYAPLGLAAPTFHSGFFH